MRKKKLLNLKTVGAAILVVLLLLIFFSKTIFTHNLPVVTAASPQNGKLSKLELTSGSAQWLNTESVYAQVGGKVESVFVREGDRVRAGQELFRMEYDPSDAERKLKELKNSKSRLNLDIKNLKLKLEKLNREVDKLKNETYEQDSVSNYELAQLLLDISKATAELQDAWNNYALGSATTYQDVTKAQYNLQSLQLKRENLEKTMVEQEEKGQKDIAEKEKDREKRLKDYQADIDAVKLDISSKQLDLSGISLQEEPYREALETFGENAAVLAPADGVIISLPVKKGEKLNENQLMAAMGVGTAFEISCAIALENNFVVVGDTCNLSNTAQSLDAVVTKVEPSAQGKTVTITVRSDTISAGETFDVRFKKESANSYTLVPNGALNLDSDGYFLYQIKRRDGIMGKEYYVDRLSVYIGDSDAENTAIVQGVSFFEPIVLLSDKGLSSGDTVSVSNEEAFFGE